MRKLLIISVLLLLLVGCEEPKAYYENVEGTISHMDTAYEARGKVSVRVIEIYVSGSAYRIDYSASREEMLRVGNEIHLKARYSEGLRHYFSEFEILADNNSRMRDILLEESRELEEGKKSEGEK